MPRTRSTAAPFELTRKDIEQSQNCQHDGCGTLARTRVRRLDGGIVPVCPACAAELLGVSGESMEKALGLWGPR